MPRILKDGVIVEFCKYADHTELPWIFALWSAVSCITAAMGRDAFIDQGHYTVYPNLYIFLVAGSGRCRKSTAIGMAENFIKKIKPPVNLFSQKASVSKLINALASVQSDDGTTMTASAEGVIIVDELSTLIDRGAFASGLIPFLTSLWDSKDTFEYATRAHGIERIYNSCVSIYGGSTIEWIKEAIPTIAIGGGFTSRIIFVYREDHNKLALRTPMTDENKKRGESIVHDLNEIAKIRGSYAITEQGWKFLDKEYIDFMTNSPFIKNRYLMGYASRRHVMLFKLAMIVSASVNSSREITLTDISVALKILQTAEAEMPTVLEAIASDEIGALTNQVLMIIKKYKEIGRPLLMRLLTHKMQAKDLDVILETLELSDYIIIVGAGVKAKYVYKTETTLLKKKSFTETLLEKKDDA